jgi:hypothetical protein
MEPPPVRRTRSGSALQAVIACAPQPPAGEVAVFWDYENMPLGKLFSMDALAKLSNHARSWGRLLEFRLYSDSLKFNGPNGARRQVVDHLGITFVDCPTADKKEAVDKKIIVDALCWALPRATQRTPSTIVLVSSDGDYSHAISRLRAFGVRTVAIGTSRALAAASDVSLTLGEACGVASDAANSHQAAAQQSAATMIVTNSSAAASTQPLQRGQALVRSRAPRSKQLVTGRKVSGSSQQRPVKTITKRSKASGAAAKRGLTTPAQPARGNIHVRQNKMQKGSAPRPRARVGASRPAPAPPPRHRPLSTAAAAKDLRGTRAKAPASRLPRAKQNQRIKATK